MPDYDAEARALYEEATAKARRYTAAAWVRWEDADADCRAAWLTFAEGKGMWKKFAPDDGGDG